jgi:hypothetical protein
MRFNPEKWLDTKTADLVVHDDNVWFHNHAEEILSFKKNYLKIFKDALSQKIDIKTRVKTSERKPVRGIKADFLNKEVRRLLRLSIDNLREEVNEEHGVFYYTSKEKKQIAGFDFAILNSCENVNRLYDLCFGKLRYVDGQKRWNRFLTNNPELMHYMHNIEFKNFSSEIDEPLILGEIQFGNWALAYRDLFKILKANVQTSVDCLVYICPTGDLESMLSDGIVTFGKTKKIIQEFSKIINVPVMLIGLDIKL